MCLYSKIMCRLVLPSVFTLVSSAASANLPDLNQWQFEVLLDNKKIGYHDFTVQDQANSQTIESTARFDVKILFVNVYRYRHQTTETWQGNCLASIDAETDANGKDFTVQGKTAGNQFQLQTQSSANTLPSCIKTFAYWNPDFLAEDRLLNSQTGEYEDVTINKLGQESLSVSGEKILAVKYKVEVKAGPITLWYAADDHRWLALESELKGGRILRYEPVKIPDSVTNGYVVAGRL